jgi:hypothetical protein
MQDFQDLEMAQCKKNSQQQFVTLLQRSKYQCTTTSKLIKLGIAKLANNTSF